MSDIKGTVLAASENKTDLQRLYTGLRAEGYDVIPIADRTKILKCALYEVPILILLDLDLGFDICRMLKRNFVTERIPVIAILSSAGEADRIAILELGADDCLAKPFNFRELTLRVKASLNRAQDKKGKMLYKQAKNYSALIPPSRPK